MLINQKLVIVFCYQQELRDIIVQSIDYLQIAKLCGICDV